MKKLSLFSGIGGIDLAAHWAGIQTVAFCEREPFPQKVLNKHWPDVPIYDDVKTLTKARLEADGIDTGSIGIVSAGYPCQPFSSAGDRKGENDDRHLWPEAKRILQEIRPPWFVGENVAGHITLGLDQVLTDLDDIGYTSQSFVIPACAVGANHRRDRVFIASHTKSNSIHERKVIREISEKENWQPGRGLVKDVPRKPWEKDQPEICRVDDGISGRLDKSRLKSLGNAVNPYQIYPIMAAIKAIDDAIGR